MNSAPQNVLVAPFGWPGPNRSACAAQRAIGASLRRCTDPKRVANARDRFCPVCLEPNHRNVEQASLEVSTATLRASAEAVEPSDPQAGGPGLRRHSGRHEAGRLKNRSQSG